MSNDYILYTQELDKSFFEDLDKFCEISENKISEHGIKISERNYGPSILYFNKSNQIEYNFRQTPLTIVLDNFSSIYDYIMTVDERIIFNITDFLFENDEGYFEDGDILTDIINRKIIKDKFENHYHATFFLKDINSIYSVATTDIDITEKDLEIYFTDNTKNLENFLNFNNL